MTTKRVTHHTVQQPIFVNLSGDYFIPKTATTPVQASSITGDLRLAELDAFLYSLNANLSGTSTVALDKKLEDFLSQVATSIKRKATQSTVELEIQSSLKPLTNEMIYTFKFNISNGASN